MGRSMTNSMLNICAKTIRAMPSQTALAKSASRHGRTSPMSNPMRRSAAAASARLAACFLDSMATLGRRRRRATASATNTACSATRSRAAKQVEQSRQLARLRQSLGVPRRDELHTVQFHGRVVEVIDAHGREEPTSGSDADDVMAMANDIRIPGYGTGRVNTLRLWTAKATQGFDLSTSTGATTSRPSGTKNDTEDMSKVLYPDDSTAKGRELRLKQQYFFVSAASLQDMPYRHSEGARRARRAAGQGGRSAQRHASLDRGGRVDAPDLDEHHLIGPAPGNRHAGLRVHDTTR